MKSEHDEIHDEIKDMLHEYLHGTLSAEKAALVKAHLSGCDECAIEVNIAVDLLKIGAPDPGAVYFNNLTKTVISSARANTPKRFNLWNYILRIFRPIPIAAAASLCLAIYLTVFSLGNFRNSNIKHIQPASNTHNNITRNYITHHTQNTNIVVDTSHTDDTLYSLLMEEDYGDGFASVYGGYDHEDDSHEE